MRDGGGDVLVMPVHGAASQHPRSVTRVPTCLVPTILQKTSQRREKRPSGRSRAAEWSLYKEAAGPDIDKKAAAAERQAKDHKQAAEPGQGERSGQVRGRSRAAPRRAAKRKRKKQARADDATVEREREEAARAMPTDPRDRQQ